MLKIGITKEGKSPPDHRTPLTPAQAKYIQDTYEVEIVVQASTFRCYADEDYQNEGIAVVNSLLDCDIILGIKEVPIQALIANKTYFFFSHIIKKQPYNKKLLQAILAKKVRLIDWETIQDAYGNRLIAFGRWAGIVGAYNGLIAYGIKYQQYALKRAYQCLNYKELTKEYTKIKLPNIKIAITGNGRVAHRAKELLHAVDIRQVSPHDFLSLHHQESVFTQLFTKDYHVKKYGGKFVREDFYKNPTLYDSHFIPYAKTTDILIVGAYWSPNAPILFTKEDMCKDDFNIKVISDVSCDIDGAIPSTQRASTINDPFYDYNPNENNIEKAFANNRNITVTAVDNLPCELPRDASEHFGNQIIKNILPHIISQDKEKVLARATLTKDGKLTSKYHYLKDFAEEK